MVARSAGGSGNCLSWARPSEVIGIAWSTACFSLARSVPGSCRELPLAFMLAQMALALDWYPDLEMVAEGDGGVRDAAVLLVQAARASRARLTHVSRCITDG